MLVLGVGGISLFRLSFLGEMSFLWLCLMGFFYKFSNTHTIYFGGQNDKINNILTTLSVWLFVILYLLSFKYKKNSDFKKYKVVLWALLVCLYVSFLRGNILIFYIFFEISLVPLMLLILGWGYQRERVQASFYLFMYTLVGSLPLLMVLLVFFHKARLWWIVFSIIKWQINFFYIFLLNVFIVLRFIIKLPAFGFHLWLPKAHVEAPASGSIILAAILLKFRAYGVYRIMFITGRRALLLSWWALFLLFGSFLSSVVAFSQNDIKSLVAFSSVSHIGAILAGVLFGFITSNMGRFIIMVTHGFCSSALFFIVGLFYEKRYSRQIVLQSGNINMYAGLRFWWFIFLAINFSAPPFVRLIGEVFIFFFSLSLNIRYVLILIGAGFFVAFFCIFFYRAIIHGKSSKSLHLLLVRDIFFFVLFVHLFPGFFLISKLEFLWYCLYIFKKNKGLWGLRWPNL